MDDLFTLVYAELRRIAGRQLRGERSDHTLCTTALVHEAWFELAKLERIRWESRTHFLALAAQAMRRVLIDYAVADSGTEARRVGLDSSHNVVFDFQYSTGSCDSSWNAVPFALDNLQID